MIRYGAPLPPFPLQEISRGLVSRTSQTRRHLETRVRVLALVLLLLGVMMLAAPGFADPPEFQIDPLTGNAVAQLTTLQTLPGVLAQDNYALYYHQNSQSEDGQFLIYRYIECTCTPNCRYNAASLEYRRLDLETGNEELMVGQGLANSAVVHGPYLYVGTRDVTNQPYQRLERIPLDDPNGTTSQCLTPLPAGHNLGGAVTVNADGTVVIYQTYLQGKIDKGFATWAHFIDPNANGTCPTTHTDLELHPIEPGIEHVHFSPTDPTTFTFVDQPEASLKRVGIGTVTATGFTWNSLSTSSNYLLSFADYPHPFWDADGSLWSDAIVPSGPGVAEAFVRFDLDETTGWVQSFVSVPMTSADWHHHQGGGRSIGWFVGDGLNTVSRAGFGEPFISLFRPEPPSWGIGGSLDRYHLADSLGAEDSGRGNYGANAHLLETLDGAVFAAPYDFTLPGPVPGTVCPTDSRNIFLVKIPTHLQARLRDAVTLGTTGDGPFRHASRLAVSADGQSWDIDYAQGGSTPSIGDGALDRTAGGIASNPFRLGLADINGDGVDDRLAFSPIASGGWTIDLAYSPYDGVLPQATVPAEVSRDFTGLWTVPPVFGDLNGDGRDDLVRIEISGSQVLWQAMFSENSNLPLVPYVNLGLPWETASAFGDPNQDVHFFAADVDGDGYADRVAVRPEGAWWRWSVDLSTSAGFGDGVEDSVYVGASNATDTPLMADVTLDGRADIVIAREQSLQLRWYVNPSSGSHFGSAWDPPFGRGFFGAAGEQPLIGTFGRFHSVQP